MLVQIVALATYFISHELRKIMKDSRCPLYSCTDNPDLKCFHLNIWQMLEKSSHPRVLSLSSSVCI